MPLASSVSPELRPGTLRAGVMPLASLYPQSFVQELQEGVMPLASSVSPGFAPRAGVMPLASSVSPELRPGAPREGVMPLASSVSPELRSAQSRGHASRKFCIPRASLPGTLEQALSVLVSSVSPGLLHLRYPGTLGDRPSPSLQVLYPPTHGVWNPTTSGRASPRNSETSPLRLSSVSPELLHCVIPGTPESVMPLASSVSPGVLPSVSVSQGFASELWNKPSPTL